MDNLHDDCSPLDVQTLPDDTRRLIIEAAMAYDKRCLRAAALHQSLAARGLAAEADALRIRSWNSDWDAPKLEAMEALTMKLLSGGADQFTSAIDAGDQREVLAALGRLHDPTGPIATGERLAAILICKDEAELSESLRARDVAEALLEQIERTADSLERRLSISLEAIDRLKDIFSTKLQ